MVAAVAMAATPSAVGHRLCPLPAGPGLARPVRSCPSGWAGRSRHRPGFQAKLSPEPKLAPVGRGEGLDSAVGACRMGCGRAARRAACEPQGRHDAVAGGDRHGHRLEEADAAGDAVAAGNRPAPPSPPDAEFVEHDGEAPFRGLRGRSGGVVMWDGRPRCQHSQFRRNRQRRCRHQIVS